MSVNAFLQTCNKFVKSSPILLKMDHRDRLYFKQYKVGDLQADLQHRNIIDALFP